MLTWWASDHIPLSEVPTAWCDARDPTTGLLDPYHINSVEPEGNDLLMSFRHLDAVYSVRKSNGSIEWKIGGVTQGGKPDRPERPGFLGWRDVLGTARRPRHARRLDHVARQRLAPDGDSVPRAPCDMCST